MEHRSINIVTLNLNKRSELIHSAARNKHMCMANAWRVGVYSNCVQIVVDISAVRLNMSQLSPEYSPSVRAAR